MSSKSIIPIIIGATIIAGLFIVNSVIGAKIASNVDEQLQAMLTENEANVMFRFEYAEISSNPLERSVTISGFKMHGADLFPADMQVESVKLKMPISQTLALARNKELKSINKMSIDFQNPVFKSEDTAAKFNAKSMKVTFI